MLFSSYEFIFAFLPITVLLFWAAGRWAPAAVVPGLIFASLAFYAWQEPWDVVLIVTSMTVNYFFGAALAKNNSRLLLVIGVGFNLGLLAYFKYANFAIKNFNYLLGLDLNLDHTVTLPLAISFFTFLQVAYLVDAYSRKTDAHGFQHYVLFVTFFPHLIAGPLIHHNDIIQQFRRENMTLRASNVAIGFSVFALGLIKKIGIADTMGGYVEPVFGAAAGGQDLGILAAWGGALAYTFQIYFDFSAYSDMALGLGRMFSIRFPSNFASPYRSQSIIEFWRRWHQTLSRFLRDYLYIPLGGSRRGNVRTYVNLMIVMILGGLWHGAAWTFVVWGGLHGLYLLVNHLWRMLRNGPLAMVGRVPVTFRRIMSWAITFLAVVVAWVFFRAPDFTTAVTVLKAMAGIDSLFLPSGYAAHVGAWGELIGIDRSRSDVIFQGRDQLAWLAAGLAIVLVAPNSDQWMARWGLALESYQAAPAPLQRWLQWQPSLVWALASAGMFLAAVSMLGSYQAFLYFNF